MSLGVTAPGGAGVATGSGVGVSVAGDADVATASGVGVSVAGRAGVLVGVAGRLIDAVGSTAQPMAKKKAIARTTGTIPLAVPFGRRVTGVVLPSRAWGTTLVGPYTVRPTKMTL